MRSSANWFSGLDLTQRTTMNSRSIADLVATSVARAQEQPLPESTYRLQFHSAFTFRNAIEIIPYLRDLGITHVYASPYLKARAGSTHGYDIVDHRLLNPEIGTDEDHEAFVAALQQHGLRLILDIVPNHMGIATNDNVWWNDVLENGPSSRLRATSILPGMIRLDRSFNKRSCSLFWAIRTEPF